MPDFANPRVSSDPLPLRRASYALRGAWRFARVRAWVTQALGPQYRRSRDAIEIDLTWSCNLACTNCNRSVRQAPTAERMTLAQVQAFVDQTRATGQRWRKVRLLGGEPTLHPEFDAIMELLCDARDEGLLNEVQVSTNGHGPRVQAALTRLPWHVVVDNSEKEGDVQPHFGDFNMAPRDSQIWKGADFRNGCWVAEGCGMGLTPYGYYPCAVAGGIDRVLGLGLGRSALPAASDDMLEEMAALCAWCGRFKTGHFVPRDVRRPLVGEPQSPSWVAAYARWRERRPKLRRFGESG